LCLARFDELKQLGLHAFTRKYDPYWDIPLNESLPQPVIDLPLPGDDGAADPTSQSSVEAPAPDDGEFRLTGAPKAKRGRKKR
jgi:hypothetical protein